MKMPSKISKAAAFATGRVGRFLYVSSSKRFVGLPVCKILGLARRYPAKLEPFEALAEQSWRLSESSPFSVISPVFPNHPSERLSGTFPAVQAFRLLDVRIGTHTSVISKNRALMTSPELIQKRSEIPQYAGNLGYFDPVTCIAHEHHHEELEKGILLDGDGTYNWYHFLIENLPKVLLAKHLPASFDDYPLIVPPECEKIPNFAAALAAVAEGRPTVTIAPRTRVKVADLITIGSIVHAPFNLYPGLWPVPTDYSQHDNLLLKFAQVMRHALVCDNSKTDFPVRIFLQRPILRRNHNQDELIEIAARFGFVPVSPEKMTLREQATMFANANYVIGASGAAWSNMIFRDRPMRGLSWLFPEYSGFCSYSTLAHMLGHKIAFLEGHTNRPLRSTEAAYSRDYTVRTEEFITSLERLMAEDE